MRVDGHDPAAVARAIDGRRRSDRPTLIACKTTIGYGAPKKAGTSKAHGEPLGAEELAGAKAALGWNGAAFDVPDDDPQRLGAGGQARPARAQSLAEAARRRLPPSAVPSSSGASREAPSGLAEAIAELKGRLVAEPQTVATRKASEIALEVDRPRRCPSSCSARPT